MADNPNDQQPQQPPAGAAAQPDLAALVRDQVAAALKPITDQLGQLSGAIQKPNNPREVRERFIREKLGDMPEIYKSALPASSDPNELAKHEQQLRDMYKRDLAAAGFKPKDVTGDAGTAGTAAPAAAASPPIDTGSAVDNIAAGLAEKANAPR